jgi:hypothetical protein
MLLGGFVSTHRLYRTCNEVVERTPDRLGQRAQQLEIITCDRASAGSLEAGGAIHTNSKSESQSSL